MQTDSHHRFCLLNSFEYLSTKTAYIYVYFGKIRLFLYTVYTVHCLSPGPHPSLKPPRYKILNLLFLLLDNLIILYYYVICTIMDLWHFLQSFVCWFQNVKMGLLCIWMIKALSVDLYPHVLKSWNFFCSGLTWNLMVIFFGQMMPEEAKKVLFFMKGIDRYNSYM